MDGKSPHPLEDKMQPSSTNPIYTVSYFQANFLWKKSLRDGLRNEVLHTISARCFNSWCRDLRPQISIQQRKQNENKIRHKKIREIPVVGGKMPV